MPSQSSADPRPSENGVTEEHAIIVINTLPKGVPFRRLLGSQMKSYADPMLELNAVDVEGSTKWIWSNDVRSRIPLQQFAVGVGPVKAVFAVVVQRRVAT